MYNFETRILIWLQRWKERWVAEEVLSKSRHFVGEGRLTDSTQVGFSVRRKRAKTTVTYDCQIGRWRDLPQFFKDVVRNLQKLIKIKFGVILKQSLWLVSGKSMPSSGLWFAGLAKNCMEKIFPSGRILCSLSLFGSGSNPLPLSFLTVWLVLFRLYSLCSITELEFSLRGNGKERKKKRKKENSRTGQDQNGFTAGIQEVEAEWLRTTWASWWDHVSKP